jgi:acyl-ACP thioesterase
VLEDPLVPLPEVGRVFRTRRKVRLGDASPSRRLRLDACARYLQDVGNDDTADSGLDETAGVAAGIWVVRRAVVDVVAMPGWNDWVELATWCSGVGGRWAERRLSLRAEDGDGRVEVSTLWVHLDPRRMMPARLPDRFMELYGEAAQGRTVSAKLWLNGGPPDGSDADAGPEAVERIPWPLRAVDFDVMGHVNNAAYWAAIEQVLSLHRDHPAHPSRGPMRAVLEFGKGIEPEADLELVTVTGDKQIDVWFVASGQSAAAARMILPNLPPSANRS